LSFASGLSSFGSGLVPTTDKCGRSILVAFVAQLACSMSALACKEFFAVAALPFPERRWSSRTFRYGYLVTTSPQSRTLPW